MGAGLLFLCATLRAQEEQEPLEEVQKNPWSLSLWGQHRSNAMNQAMGSKLLRGGYIGEEQIQDVRANFEGDIGVLGAAAGAEWEWTSSRQWKSSSYRLCGSIHARALGEVRLTPELFDLIFEGNEGHLGRWDVLDGSRLRASSWYQVAVGLEGRHRNRLELGVVYRPFHVESWIRTGSFFVDESVDSLYVSVRADAVYDASAGWGLALNGQWHFMREEAPFAVHFHMRNVGVVAVPGGGGRSSVDTLMEMSGLTFQGSEWSLETLQQQGFGEGLLSIDTAKVSLQMLPARFDLAIEWPLSPLSGLDATVQVGEWMAWPRAMLGYRRAFGRNWQAGVQGVVGGWGSVRPAAWVRWRAPGAHAWMLYVEDPWGWGGRSGFGRGITLRFEGL